jgi:hypothetical protein
MKIDGACHCGYIRVEGDADPEKTTVCHCIGRRGRRSHSCKYVWTGRAVQDELPRSTNVRAASMYQPLKWSAFAPGHHGYLRASETS